MLELIVANAWVIAILSMYLLAAFSAARAILHTRTAQGSMAWVLALLLMPPLAVPLYWVFGRTKFYGYVGRRQRVMEKAREHLLQIEELNDFLEPPPGAFAQLHTLARRLGAGGFLRGNRVRLLIDGEATYQAMLDDLERARLFALVQFYIFRDDTIGRRFQQAMIDRARAGVAVYFLFDQVGSNLGREFLAELDAAGVRCHSFDPGRKGSRFQLNFRNHRKILVVDGETAFVGGLNVGDDYLGRHERRGPWRDTHLRITGPAAAQAQIAFYKDWYWAADELPKADFRVAEACAAAGRELGIDANRPTPAGATARVLLWHTGPADAQPECLLTWLDLIGTARERLWIANPYFVPPEAILQALRLALVRGVEVRILVPGNNDSVLVALASNVYQAEMASCGAQVYRWPTGFMHQKVCLVDDQLALVGSANLDNRSVFINFEISAFSDDPELIAEVAAMLESDFAASERISLDEFRNAHYWRRLSCRAADLCAPML